MNTGFNKKNNEYIPSNAIIEVTLACNFSCFHCGSSAGKPRKDELSLYEIKNLVNDLKFLGCKSITLMGGEIFLRQDWKLIVEYINKLSLEWGIVTNGYLLNEDIINYLKKTGITQIAISLDSSNSKTNYLIRGIKDSFSKSLNAINLSINEKIPIITIITTVNKLNINELDDIFSLIKNLNFPLDWQIKIASNHNQNRFPDKYFIDVVDYYKIAGFISRAKIELSKNNIIMNISEAHDLGYFSKKFNNIAKNWNGCLAGKYTIGIQSNGNVKGCLALTDSFIESNIREKSLINIWKDPDNFSYSRKFENFNLNEICSNCEDVYICKGGCMDFHQSLQQQKTRDIYCLKYLENSSSIS